MIRGETQECHGVSEKFKSIQGISCPRLESAKFGGFAASWWTAVAVVGPSCR